MKKSEALCILLIKESLPSMDEIKKQYRILAFKHHPDRGGDTETMKKINQAYELLITQQDNSSDDCGTEEFVFLGMVIQRYRGLTMVSGGKSFKFKEKLKKCGFRWDNLNKTWWKKGYFEIEREFEAA